MNPVKKVSDLLLAFLFIYLVWAIWLTPPITDDELAFLIAMAIFTIIVIYKEKKIR